MTGNANEQTSLKPLEEKVLQDFGCTKFIYCSDAGLSSEAIKKINHAGERAFIVTQSIKKLNKDDKKWALDRTGFKRVSDDTPVDLSEIPEDDNGLYYKDEPYTPHTLHQRLIVTYSPKYARYQKTIRDVQDVKDILKVSEGRWEIEECFRIMKTDFEARPVFLHDDVRIKAHFLICFLSLVIYRYLERGLEYAFTCETILDKLKTINFADIQEQGFIPLYTRDRLSDALHEICGFDTDFKFITKSQMKTIQKKVKAEDKIP